MIKIVSEFRQLTGPVEYFTFYHKRRVPFFITLPDMQIEHKSNECALQTGTGSVQNVKTAAGQFHTAIKIDDPQRRSQIPVRNRIKLSFRDFPFVADDHIFRIADTVGYARIRDIGNNHDQRI